MIEKKRRADRAAAGARRVERRLAVFADGVRVRPGLQEEAQGVRVAVEGGEVDRRHAPAADAVEPQPLGGNRDGVRVVRVTAGLLPHADEVRQRLVGLVGWGWVGGKGREAFWSLFFCLGKRVEGQRVRPLSGGAGSTTGTLSHANVSDGKDIYLLPGQKFRHQNKSKQNQNSRRGPPE